MTDLTARTEDYLVIARMESSSGRDHRADLTQAICFELAALRGAVEALAPKPTTEPRETEDELRVEMCRDKVVRPVSAVDLDRLEALAREATPSPWSVTDGKRWPNAWRSATRPGTWASQVWSDAPGYESEPILRSGPGWMGEVSPDVAYVAALDPATVLALIARVREAEAEPKERCEAETPINDPYGSDPTFWLRCVHDEGHDGPHHADDGDHERDWDDEPLSPHQTGGGTLAFRDPAGLMRAEGLKRVRLEGGERIWAHRRRDCIGPPCPIHHRTNHHMRGWRQHWRADRSLMERTCPHGIGHPDPDQRLTDGGVHGCDGCCRTKEEAGR